jgi:hypothetical protein
MTLIFSIVIKSMLFELFIWLNWRTNTDIWLNHVSFEHCAKKLSNNGESTQSCKYVSSVDWSKGFGIKQNKWES